MLRQLRPNFQLVTLHHLLNDNDIVCALIASMPLCSNFDHPVESISLPLAPFTSISVVSLMECTASTCISNFVLHEAFY